jgi:cell wall-associated NlpC family hydrolase
MGPTRQPGKRVRGALAIGCLTVLAAGCLAPRPAADTDMENTANQTVLDTLQSVRERFAPDSHLAIFNIKARQDGGGVTLQGEVDNPAARQAALEAVAAAGFRVSDQVNVLPDSRLGGRVWGIATLSVVNAREKPGHASEMGTQLLMGNVFRLWKSRTNWFLLQGDDGYLGWTEAGAFTACTRQEAEAWQTAPLLTVTAWEERILEQPSADSLPVSDVVMCDLVKHLGEEGHWFKVALPDGRSGYLPKSAAEDEAQWRKSRSPTPENIERTAKSLLGRPYFWGCNSIRGMDCSGFSKLVFHLNGIELNRNASQQCRQGIEVPLGEDLKHLQKGDLLFFGRPDRRTGLETITHVGIYLGDKLFIHSSENVHISSLDPRSPLRDRLRIRSLLHARRVLPAP